MRSLRGRARLLILLLCLLVLGAPLGRAEDSQAPKVPEERTPLYWERVKAEESLGAFKSFDTTSSGESGCSELLRGGVFNSLAIRTRYDVRSIWDLWLSSQSYKSIESSAGIDIPVVELSIGGKFNEENFNAWQSKYKGEHQEAFSYDMLLKVADEGILRAYNECVGLTSPGIFVRVKNPPGAEVTKDTPTLIVELSYRKAPGMVEKIKLKEILLDGCDPVKQVDGTMPLLFTKGTELENGGTLSALIKRQGDEKARPAVTLSINTENSLSTGFFLEAYKKREAELRWFDADETGAPYIERFQYTGPERHEKPAQIVTNRWTISHPKGEITKIECAGVAGPVAWDWNPDKGGYEPWIAVDPDRRTFQTRRTHGSYPTTYVYTVYFRVQRLVEKQ